MKQLSFKLAVPPTEAAHQSRVVDTLVGMEVSVVPHSTLD